MDDQLTPRRGGGRKSRGDRRMFRFAVLETTYLQLLDQARQRGLGLSEYVCAELAVRHGLEVPDYIQPALEMELPYYPPLARKTITTRVPVDHHATYVRAAGAQGVSLAEYSRITLGISSPASDHQEGFEVSLLSA
jgi:hypothetical protein